MLLHFLNNAAVLAFTAIPAIQDQSATIGEERPPLPLLVTGSIFFLLGLSVLRRSHGEQVGA